MYISDKAWRRVVEYADLVYQALHQPQSQKDIIISTHNITEFLTLTLQEKYIVIERRTPRVKKRELSWCGKTQVSTMALPALHAVWIGQTVVNILALRLSGQT